MKTLATMLALALGFSPGLSFASSTHVIWKNEGGETEAYHEQARTYAKMGTKIEIRGECSSACNIFLMREYKLDVCAGPRGWLGFHMPFMASATTEDDLVINRSGWAIGWSFTSWVKDWLGKFNPKLNRILQKATDQGQIPSAALTGDNRQVFVVKADQVLPPCR